jgi:hypothetical protein
MLSVENNEGFQKKFLLDCGDLCHSVQRIFFKSAYTILVLEGKVLCERLSI